MNNNNGFLLHRNQTPGIMLQSGRQVIQLLGLYFNSFSILFQLIFNSFLFGLFYHFSIWNLFPSSFTQVFSSFFCSFSILFHSFSSYSYFFAVTCIVLLGLKDNIFLRFVSSILFSIIVLWILPVNIKSRKL